MKQLPELAVAVDRLGTNWNQQQQAYLPPSDLRAGDACRFAFPLPKHGHSDVAIEVIRQTIAEYVDHYFRNSRDHSGVFLRCQGWLEKEPG